MRKHLTLFAAAFVLSFACAAQALGAAEELTVRGRLARTVEAGGWLIRTSGPRYLILNPEKFREEIWFREDTEVEATGETKPGAITIHMEGVPFEARTMQPRGGEGAAAVVAGSSLTSVSVVGDARVEAQPDTATVMLAVVTQNRNASEAQAENATRTEAVVRAVRAAAGQGAEVKTSGYSLQPQYVYKENEPPLITGYIARNGVMVTMGELNRVGAVIDAASLARANTVDNISFSLRRDQQARAQALADATREAISKAQVIAQALGGRVVRIVAVQEAGAVQPIPVLRRQMAEMGRAAAQISAPTPIEPGSLTIISQVQLVAEVETK